MVAFCQGDSKYVMIGYMLSSQLSDEIHQHGCMKKLKKFEEIFYLRLQSQYLQNLHTIQI